MFFLKPLLLTLVFELLIAFLLGLRGKDLLLVFLANLITNPLLSLLVGGMNTFLSAGQIQLVVYLLLEPLIVLFEAFLFQHYLNKKRNGLLLSFLLNCGSILGGILWNLLF
ncbi:MAG: hypothetical protein IIV88_06290 [Erysipelotrichaceae bacterium]|nr:hypothetical protein [Erysipelotrichaceae bacterium]